MIPWYITAIVIVTDLAIAAAVWSLISTASGRSGLPAAQRRVIRTGSAVFLAAWLGAILLLAPSPGSLVNRDPFDLTPLIPLATVVPLGLLGVALWRSPALRRVIAAAPLPLLIGVQAYRVIGAVFLVLFAQGLLPGHFALPAGWGDLAIGLAAPVVGLALARGVTGARTLATAWNVVGLADLVVAVGMGTGLLVPFLAPELGSRVPPVGPMGVFPLLLVPAFAVPISVGLHLAALVRLARPAGSARDVAGGPLEAPQPGH